MKLRLLSYVFLVLGSICIPQCWAMDNVYEIDKKLSNMLYVNLLEKTWNRHHARYDDKVVSAYGSVKRWIDYKWDSNAEAVHLFCPIVLAVSRLDMKHLGQFDRVKHGALFDSYKAVYYKKGRGAFIFCQNYDLESDDFPFINQIIDWCAKDKIEWN